MLTPSILILLASAGLIEAGPFLDARHQVLHRRANGNDATATTLAANAIQSGSFVDGSKQIGANENNQAKSQTSTNNFINYCAGKTLSNGLQITTGSCNGIPMGDLPAKTAMVSSIITFPPAGSATIQSDTTFNITVQMSNLVAGSFTNADATYFSAPQFLQGGQVVGHTHVTVQDMGNSLNPTTALNPTQFAFFKGINDAGNGKGLLSATVTGGLPKGNYRVCTMAAASNHQPVIMPVAQRGTADDCTKFTVIGSGTTKNIAANDGSKGQAAAALAASAVAAGPGAIVSSSASAAAATGKGSKESTSTKAANGNGNGGKQTSASASVASASSKAGNGNKATSSAASATSSAGNGNKASSSVASATSKAGNGNKASSSAAAATATSSAGNGNKGASSSSALGGITAPAITKSGDAARPFEVNGNSFVTQAAALQRSCDIQMNACSDAVNGGKAKGAFTLSDCNAQQSACNAGGS